MAKFHPFLLSFVDGTGYAVRPGPALKQRQLSDQKVENEMRIQAHLASYLAGNGG